ncbi:MAG: transposase family protein [Traorella sp.]
MWSISWEVFFITDFNKIVASILNVPLNEIDSIHVAKDNDKSILFVKLKRHVSCCPICDNTNFLSNGYYKRKIKVPSNALNNIDIVLNIRRFRCNNCNHTFSEPINMAPAYKSISYAVIL